VRKLIVTAITLAVVLGAIFVGYGYVTAPYVIEGRAAEALAAAGADVETVPVDAGLVQWLVGERNCVRVVGISARRLKNTDDMLAETAVCEHLQRVQLENTDVSDQGLKTLADKTELESLEILGSKRIPSRLTDEGVGQLAHLSKLQRLAVTDAQVTDKSLTIIATFPQLRNLSLHRTAITGENLDKLAELPKLKWLHLNGTRVTDDSMRAAAALKGLEHLSLTNTGISDSAIEHLRQLRHLDRLSIGGTRISDEGREQLKTSLRGVIIDF
jgi:hypothetical protein